MVIIADTHNYCSSSYSTQQQQQQCAYRVNKQNLSIWIWTSLRRRKNDETLEHLNWMKYTFLTTSETDSAHTQTCSRNDSYACTYSHACVRLCTRRTLFDLKTSSFIRGHQCAIATLPTNMTLYCQLYYHWWNDDCLLLLQQMWSTHHHPIVTGRMGTHMFLVHFVNKCTSNWIGRLQWSQAKCDGRTGDDDDDNKAKDSKIRIIYFNWLSPLICIDTIE